METQIKKPQFMIWAVIIFLINPISSQSDDLPAPKCFKSDSDALLVFKAAISKDTTASLATWNPADSGCCSGGWEGVSCDANGRVNSLSLQSRLPSDYMIGNLSSSLGKLLFLEALSITEMKRISGIIPDSFSSLTHLKSLVLDDNALFGPIPPSLANLKSLEVLSLTGNRFTGRIPDSLGSLSNLKGLTLGNNLLTGPIPIALKGVTGLTTLDLSFNSFSGPIPGFLGQYRNLTDLVLSGNRLSGPIPDSLFGLSQVSHLSIDQNQLTGEIPAGIGNLKSVSVLSLSCNSLTGQVPVSISHLQKLWSLNLSRNSLTGPLPDKGFPGLLSIDLSYNNLALNTIPGWIVNRALYDVRLAGLKLGGVLPNFTEPRSLNRVDLSDNYFKTGLLGFFKRLTSLETVNISNNLLYDNLSMIRLPDQVSVIDLSSNRLFGSLSGILSNRTSSLLEVIDVSRNNISGHIPDFGDGLILKVLNLGSNKIAGQIPVTVSKLEKLERFDISRNQVTGKIPNPWTGSVNLKHVSFRNNGLCGQIPQIRPFNIFPAAAYANNKCLCDKPLQPCKIISN